VFDLRTRRLKWTQHLDLSTDTTTYRAYAYASPTLADIDQCVAIGCKGYGSLLWTLVLGLSVRRVHAPPTLTNIDQRVALG